MVQTRNLLQELLSTIADFRPKFRSDKDNTSITDLSKNLLGVDDETSQQRIGKLILGKYEQLDEDEKKAFFQFLTDEMDLDSHAILSHVTDYQHHRDADSLSKLLDASEPLRQDFLRRLNQVAGATEVLVNMRADLLRFAAQ
ncbi:MAG: malonyl-CoA decarboxylase N-terminal domain-containing protein, partial [Candidatus Puniceispirillaceae bacterium]